MLAIGSYVIDLPCCYSNNANVQIPNTITTIFNTEYF